MICVSLRVLVAVRDSGGEYLHIGLSTSRSNMNKIFAKRLHESLLTLIATSNL